jgi:hypothetical protein
MVTIDHGRREADWYIANMKAGGKAISTRLTDDRVRCFAVLSAITAPSGIYNLSTPCSVTDAIRLFPGGMSVLLMNEFSTHDFDHLTRIVVASHQMGVRTSISPWRPHAEDDDRLALVATWRYREYDMGEPGDRLVLDESMAYGILELTLHARGEDRSRGWGYHPTPEELAERATR